MVKNTDSLDDFKYNFVNGKYLNDYFNSNGVIIGSDFHGGKGLENLLESANKNNLTAFVNGDITNDYHFAKYSQELGYKTQSVMEFEYFEDKLSQKDKETYFLLKRLEQTGGDISPFLDNIPKENHGEFEKLLKETINYSKTEEFNNNLNKVYSNFVKEKGEEIQENTIKNQLFYQVFMDAEAQNMAEILNNYSETKVLFNKGNHENTYFVEQVRNYLDNKEQIVDLTEFEGIYTIKQDNNQEITLAGMTNSVQTMPYLSEIFSKDDLNNLYSHMSLDDIKKKSMMSGKYSKEDIDNLEEILKKDRDYNRIYKNGKKKDLDIFLTHGQVGIPYLSEGKEGYEIPYQGVAAYFSDKAKLTIEGHIHSYYDGKNSSGNDMIRPAGQFGVIIKKDDFGDLIKEKIELDKDYTGGQNNEIKYDLDLIKNKVEELYSQLISKPVNNLDYDSDSKSA